MSTSFLLPTILLAGIAPAEMRLIVADRMSRLDKLAIEMTSSLYTCPPGVSPLEKSEWRQHRWGISFPHRIKLVRPNLLDENLVDDPEKGYAPVVSSVFDGGCVCRHVRPNRYGYTTYSVTRDGVQVGTYRGVPLLQVLDIHIQDSPIPQLNLLQLFEQHEVALVGAVGDVSTYVASVEGPGCVYHYEFDLNSRGTPLRFKTLLAFEAPGLQPATWEMYTLRTQEVNGAEFPTESVMTVFNPNVATTHRGLHHFEVASVRVDPGLTPEDVRIEPTLRNATVRIVGPDGMDESRWYDASGKLVRTQVFSGVRSPADGGLASRESLRWRWLIPTGSCAVALLAALGLRFASARRRRQSGQP